MHALRAKIWFHLLVGKIQDSELLLLERATLHGKLEEHDKALHILVHQLKDSPAAEEYCSWASASQDRSYRQNLFHHLLSVYLDPDLPGGSQTIAAVDLLNRHAEDFDAVRVLKLLPEEWSLPLLRPFLCGALRASVHARCTSQVAVGLARSQNLQLQHDRVSSHELFYVVGNALGPDPSHFTSINCLYEKKKFFILILLNR